MVTTSPDPEYKKRDSTVKENTGSEQIYEGDKWGHFKTSHDSMWHCPALTQGYISGCEWNKWKGVRPYSVKNDKRSHVGKTINTTLIHDTKEWPKKLRILLQKNGPINKLNYKDTPSNYWIPTRINQENEVEMGYLDENFSIKFSTKKNVKLIRRIFVYKIQNRLIKGHEVHLN